MTRHSLLWTLPLAAGCALVAPTHAQQDGDLGRRSAALVEQGLDWLAAHQKDDGRWDVDAFGGTTPQDVGVTALAVLAFMGDGHTIKTGEHKATVMRAIKWLRGQQDVETGLVGESIGHSFLYDHGIATLALSEAYASSRSPILKGTAQRAVDYIARARNPYGVWRYDVPPVGDNDTSVTSWMIQALTSAERAQLKVDPAAFEAALAWLDEVTDTESGRVGYDSRGSSSARIPGVNDHFPADAGEAMTAAAIFMRALCADLDADDPLLRKQAELVLAKRPEAQRCDLYYWYYGSHAMARVGGSHWRAWRGALVDVLEAGQADDGSTELVGPWTTSGGLVMSTALACLSLEAEPRAPRRGEPVAGPVAAERVAPVTPAEPAQEAREQISAALRWLARHQTRGGSWDADRFMDENHVGPSSCDGAGIATQDVGVTGLALLAFLGDGNTLREGPHSDAVKRAVSWLRKQQQPDSGLIGDDIGHAFHYDHAIATLALCTAYGQTRSVLIKSTAQRALDYISRARNPYGVWRYDMPPVGDNDSSVTSWMVQALVAGKDAGLKVDRRALQDAARWFDEMTDPATGRVGYDSRGSVSARVPGVNDTYATDRAEAMTGAGLLCRFLLGERPETHPVMEQHARLLGARLPAWDTEGLGCDMYAWYFGSHAMQAMGGQHAKSWRGALLAAASAGRRDDGDHEGSWDPIGPWGPWGGRVYATAMMTLCLESPYRLALEPPAPDSIAEEEMEEEPILQDFEISDHEEVGVQGWTDPMETGLARALRWLARNQAADGGWSADTEGELIHDEGVTALAALALMQGGSSSLRDGPWKAEVTRAVEWLVARQDESGRVGAMEGHAFLYEHGIATLVLVEAYRTSKSPLLKAPAQRAVDYIIRARNPHGAWRYDVPPAGDNDTSITGWMVSALGAAKTAGLRVPEDAFVGAARWFDEVTDPATGRAGYDSPGSRSSRVPGKNESYPPERGEAMTAVALYCRQLLGQTRERQPILDKHAGLLLQRQPEWDAEGLGVDMYYWYFGTRAMQRFGGKAWDAWRKSLRAALLDVQREDGDNAGSFDPVGPWGYAGGRAYSTALMALCLDTALAKR